MKQAILLFCCAMLLAAPAFSKTFKFTAIPDQDTARLEARFGQVARYLSKELGVKVEYVPVKSYSASVQAFKYDQVQLAWFGGLSGVKARLAVPGSKAIAQGVEDQEFKTYFIAHKSTGINSKSTLQKSMAGKTFTFGSKGSTSGRLMPEFYLRQAFLKSPNKFFKRVGFSGDHSKTIALVQSGAYQTGAVNYQVWDREVKEGKIDTTKVKVIWETPTYVDYNWSIRGDVDQKYGKGFAAKVQKALLNIKSKKLLDAFPRSKFIKADNKMYQPILDTGKQIGLFE